MTYYCAIDGGNATINIVVDGKTYKRPFPNIQSEPGSAKASYGNNAVYSKDTTTQLWGKLHAETSLNVDTPSKTYTDEFLFSQMAEEFKKEFRSRTNKEKYYDRDLAKVMITSLAFVLLETKMEEEAFKLKKDMNIQFVVNLSTGLPYREGSSPDKRKIWADIFKGTHRVNFKHPIFKNLKVDIVVENIEVLIEAEMALNYEMYKPGGVAVTSTAQEMLGKQVSIIDIGGHTTEVVTVSFDRVLQDDVYDEYAHDVEVNVQPVTKLDLTFGLQRGIASIMDDVLLEVQEKFRAEDLPLRPLSRRDIELAFSNLGLYNGKRGYILPEKIYIADIFNKQAEYLVRGIIRDTHTAFTSIISSLDTVYLCGGGTQFDSVVSALKRELGELKFDTDRIITVSDPTFANVRGYYFVLSTMFPDCPPLKE